MALFDSDSNTFVGHKTGYANESNANTFIGITSGLNNSTGIHNSFLGAYSGELNIDGSLNTYLGFRTGSSLGITVNNSVALGANAIVNTSNTMILGDNSVDVGIGLSGSLSNPKARLHVVRNYINTLGTPTGVLIENPDLSNQAFATSFGLVNNTSGANTINFGITSNVLNAEVNFGSYQTTINAAINANYGGYFWSQRAPYTFAV